MAGITEAQTRSEGITAQDVGEGGLSTGGKTALGAWKAKWGYDPLELILENIKKGMGVERAIGDVVNFEGINREGLEQINSMVKANEVEGVTPDQREQMIMWTTRLTDPRDSIYSMVKTNPNPERGEARRLATKEFWEAQKERRQEKEDKFYDHILAQKEKIQNGTATLQQMTEWDGTSHGEGGNKESLRRLWLDIMFRGELNSAERAQVLGDKLDTIPEWLKEGLDYAANFIIRSVLEKAPSATAFAGLNDVTGIPGNVFDLNTEGLNNLIQTATHELFGDKEGGKLYLAAEVLRQLNTTVNVGHVAKLFKDAPVKLVKSMLPVIYSGDLLLGEAEDILAGIKGAASAADTNPGLPAVGKTGTADRSDRGPTEEFETDVADEAEE